MPERFAQLARLLSSALSDVVRSRAERTEAPRVQLTVHGMPDELLTELFDELTAHGTANLHVGTSGGTVSVIVLLVGPHFDRPIAAGPALRSRECSWETVTFARNSGCPALVLASEEAWGNVPPSVEDAMEGLGPLGTGPDPRLLRSLVWDIAVQTVEARLGPLGPDPQGLAWALTTIVRQSTLLPPGPRLDGPWEVLNQLASQAASSLELFAALGLPYRSDGLLDASSLRESAATLRRLAKHMDSTETITDGIQQLTSTLRGAELVNELGELGREIAEAEAVGVDFTASPSWVFRARRPVPDWFRKLTREVLDEMLAAVDREPRRQRAQLTVRNSLNGDSLTPGEPYVVEDSVELLLEDPSGAPLTGVKIQRGTGPASVFFEPATTGPQVVFSDDHVPAHRRRQRYVVDATGLDPSHPAYVISLAHFEAHALARVASATRNNFPQVGRRTGGWRQRISIPLSGVNEIEVLHDPAWIVSELQRAGVSVPNARPGGGARSWFVVPDLQDGESCVVRLAAPNGDLSEITLDFSVEVSEEEAPASAFDSLVKANQRRTVRPTPVLPREAPLRSLEAVYIGSQNSWRPVLAAWSSADRVRVDFAWDNPVLGDVQLAFDPRPAIKPPPEVVAGREAIRQWIQDTHLRVPELFLTSPELAEKVEAYVGAYRNWLDRDPESATWFDIIAIFGSIPNPHAGRPSSTQDPVAVLLSPLHPLRLGWQFLAQRTLNDSLSAGMPCPASGLLDPHRTPDCMGLPLHQAGRGPSWKSFLSLGSDEPSWGLLLNRFYLKHDSPERQQVFGVLERLGVHPRNMAGGFSASQAVTALREVSGVLPGRATLRIGLVGSGESDSSSADGIRTWSEETLGGEERSGYFPSAVEIHDGRPNPATPVAGELANLYDVTNERVRWFHHPDASLPSACDLIILDQLGFQEPGGTSGSSRTPTSTGTLSRVRIRQDFDRARRLEESRIMVRPRTTDSLPGRLEGLSAAFEALSLKDGETSHLVFRPNQDALGLRLAEATFVAVSSTRLDPACLIRGAEATRGHLWDYELPALAGSEEEGAGYYLIARPTAAMRRTVLDAVRTVRAGITADPELLLSEVSKRGIPVLKRLAAGGAESRGELGVLLAVRLLQDCFREGGTAPRLKPIDSSTLCLVVPVDPYADIFRAFGLALGHTSRSRPDLLVVRINIQSVDRPSILVIPLEIKFRATPVGPPELKTALSQASDFAKLLKRLWEDEPPSELWRVCTRTILANMLDQGFRVYADSAVHAAQSQLWTQSHQQVIEAVLSGRADVMVAREGRLLAFGGWEQSHSLDQEGDGLHETVLISLADSAGLLAFPQSVTTDLETGFRQAFGDAGQAGGPAEPSPAPPPPTPEEGAVETAPEGPLEEVPGRLGPDQVESEPPEPVPPSLPVGDHAPIPEQPEAAPSDSTTPRVTPPPLPTHAVPPRAVPPEIRERVHAGFTGFIGNRNAVATLTRELLRALLENPPHLPKNILFTGPPSTGKTELAKRMATILELPFVRLDGRGLTSNERMVELLDRALQDSHQSPRQVGRDSGLPAYDYPPAIVFVDEVHLVPSGVQQGLLTLLERADHRSVLRTRVVLMNQVTFLLATTKASEVDRALRSRCAEIQLREYTIEEVASMTRAKHPSWDTDTVNSLAIHGRLVPRVALELADSLVTELEVSDRPELSLAGHLAVVLRSRGILDLGLTKQDTDYLSVLERQGRPTGVDAIIGLIYAVDPARVIEEVEPYLVRQGFIRLTRAGREITPRGRAYLAEWRRRSDRDASGTSGPAHPTQD